MMTDRESLAWERLSVLRTVIGRLGEKMMSESTSLWYLWPMIQAEVDEIKSARRPGLTAGLAEEAAQEAYDQAFLDGAREALAQVREIIRRGEDMEITGMIEAVEADLFREEKE